MRLQDKLQELKSSHKAILAANFYNLETLQGILNAVSNCNRPVVLQLSESSIEYIGLNIAVRMAQEAIKAFNVEAWLHLDHGSSLEIIARCLDAGFDSVMIDASEKTFEENVKISKDVVRLAEQYGANVEAELGYVAKLGQQFDKTAFTKPEVAKLFTESTGVNALAVAIGTAHGFYKAPPKLEIALLHEISISTPVPLVLHGCSGLPDNILQNSIRNGICKINLATETKNTFMQALKQILKTNEEIDLRKVFPKATNSVISLIENKLHIINDI